MNSPMQPLFLNKLDIRIKGKIHVADKNSPEVEELVSVPATMRIIRFGKELLFVATSGSLRFEAVIEAEAIDVNFIARRLKSENPTENHDAIL